MNVREWKKSKLLNSGWIFYYDEGLEKHAFKVGHIVVDEDKAFRLSLSLLSAIRMHEEGVMSDFILLQQFKNEETLNTLPVSELNTLRRSIKWRTPLKDKQ